jgi:hypothetical protein
MGISFLSAAAAGAAAGYYGFALFYGSWGGMGLLLCLFAAVPVLSLFRALESLEAPFLRYRLLGLLVFFFSAGFTLGIGAAASVPRSFSLSLQQERVNGLRGTLLDDPRSSAGGNGMAYLALDTAQGDGGLRASAKGKALVFFPPEHIPA